MVAALYDSSTASERAPVVCGKYSAPDDDGYFVGEVARQRLRAEKSGFRQLAMR